MLRRERRREETRSAILAAAQQLVGEDGYAGATVARISEVADISLGGFYTYFGSQQELFDLLLPEIGHAFFTHRDAATKDVASYLEFERRDFAALREFIRSRPEFLKIFFEAPHYAPAAYEAYIRTGRGRYLSRLQAAWDAGDLRAYRRDELPSIAEIVLSSKIYLFRMYTDGDEPFLPDTMIDTYLRFLSGGLMGG